MRYSNNSHDKQPVAWCEVWSTFDFILLLALCSLRGDHTIQICENTVVIKNNSKLLRTSDPTSSYEAQFALNDGPSRASTSQDHCSVFLTLRPASPPIQVCLNENSREDYFQRGQFSPKVTRLNLCPAPLLFLWKRWVVSRAWVSVYVNAGFAERALL